MKSFIKKWFLDKSVAEVLSDLVFSPMGLAIIAILAIIGLGQACSCMGRWNTNYEKTHPKPLMHSEMRAAVGAIAGPNSDIWPFDMHEWLGEEHPLLGHPEFFACQAGDLSSYLVRTTEHGQYKYYRVCCRMEAKKAACTVKQ